MAFADPLNNQHQSLKTKLNMEKENIEQSEDIQNSELNKTNIGKEKSDQYESIEEGKKHYARLSSQNNWLEEDMRLGEEQENKRKRLEEKE